MFAGEKSKKTIYVLVVIVSIMRLALFLRIPYYAIGSSGYDDQYLLELAASILSHSWLGSYRMTTLIKGASFPLFVAASNWLRVSYPFLLGIFYIISSGLFALIVKRISGSRVYAFLVYVLLLYNPAGFSTTITQRLYRNGLIYPAVLFVVDCVLFAYFSRNRSVAKYLFWLLMTGGSFSFFYYIREDSIWLVPFLVAALFIILVWTLFFSEYKKQAKIIRSCLVLVPVLVFVLFSTAYKYQNYRAYGVFLTNDRADGSFAELTGNMISIENGAGEEKDYWITKETLELIIENCPTLQPERESILEEYDNWADDSGNAKGDWSVWAFRIAMASNGHYSSAPEAEEYCAAVNRELVAAVADGRLQYDSALHFSTQSRGVYWEEFPEFIADSIRNIWSVSTFKDVNTDVLYSKGGNHNIRFMEAITGTHLVLPDGAIRDDEEQVQGWAVLKSTDGDYCIELIDDTGKVVGETSRIVRNDVRNLYPDYNSSGECGFVIDYPETVDIVNCSLRITPENGEMRVYSIANTEDDEVIITIDSLKTQDEYGIFSSRVIATCNQIIKIQQIAAKILIPIAMIAFILLVALFCRKPEWNRFEPLIIVLGVLLTAFVNEFGITVFTSWLGITWFYSIGTVPMMQCFEALSIGYVLKWIVDRKNRTAEIKE